MTTGQPIRSMPELIAALRERAHELQLTHQTIDSVAGLQDGYTSKLLAPTPIKNLGPVSFEAMLGALGLAVVVVEDPEQVKRVENRWTKRERPTRKPPLSIPLSIRNEVPMALPVTPALGRLLRNPEWMREIGMKGGKSRLNTMSPRKRRMIAKRAANTRWNRERERTTQPENV